MAQPGDPPVGPRNQSLVHSRRPPPLALHSQPLRWLWPQATVPASAPLPIALPPQLLLPSPGSDSARSQAPMVRSEWRRSQPHSEPARKSRLRSSTNSNHKIPLRRDRSMPRDRSFAPMLSNRSPFPDYCVGTPTPPARNKATASHR